MYQRNAFRSALNIGAMAALMLSAAAPSFVPRQVAAQPDCLAFPETSRSVCGAFLTYWKEHGGLAQQGYPISQPFQETSDVDGKTYTVQYFERAVFELHPENPPPNDVLLSLLGVLRYREKYPNEAPDKNAEILPIRIEFPETGKVIGGVFWSYWEAHGGLAQFGYPITYEFTEVSDLDGKEYTVQYFERAVFEKHPENPPEFRVLLSQLGTLQYARKYINATPKPDAWTELRQRPLNLPQVQPGVACPVTPRQLKSATSPNGQDFYVLGTGAIYPHAFAFDENTTIRLKPDTLVTNGWYVQKVPWMSDASYTGPVLIRARQLDSNGGVRMRVENPGPTPDIALDAAPGSFWPGETQLRGPGCYAYQVDGNGFSYALIFRAVLDDTVPPAPSPTPDTYAELRQRPLNLPKVAPSEACPVTPPQQINADPPTSLAASSVLGNGPIYPVASYFDAQTTLHIRDYSPGSVQWYSIKVRWVGGPNYSGPVLVRGRQLDGDDSVGFTFGGQDPTSVKAEMGLDVANGWNDWPASTNVHGPGCYAYQVDGSGFSYAIVFKAVVDNPTATP